MDTAEPVAEKLLVAVSTWKFITAQDLDIIFNGNDCLNCGLWRYLLAAIISTEK